MIEFVPATRGMLGRITEIEQQSFPDPWSEKLMEAELDTAFAKMYAAVEDGAVLGFCILRLVFGEGEIFNIAVAPEARNRGIGEGLLRHALAQAGESDADCVFLEVRQSNAFARAMYKKVGFEETGLRKGYYLSSKEDAVLMTYRYSEA